jgi:hypothetical protein
VAIYHLRANNTDDNNNNNDNRYLDAYNNDLQKRRICEFKLAFLKATHRYKYYEDDVDLNPDPDADLEKLKFDTAIIKDLPIEFLVYYMQHNGLAVCLTGVFNREQLFYCMMYPIGSGKFRRYDYAHSIKPAGRKQVVATHIGKYIIGEVNSCKILLDLNPSEHGTYGQLLFINHRYYVTSVLPDGISQWLKYLAVLDTNNIVCAMFVNMKKEGCDVFPETIEDARKKATTNPRPRKLGSLWKKMKSNGPTRAYSTQTYNLSFH